MNKYWYGMGDSIIVKVRGSHNCYKCGTQLKIFKHRKVVDPKSEEAEYYVVSGHMYMIGKTEFIHKAFFCPKCNEKIEFSTQLGMEDIDIIMTKVVKYFGKKGRNVSITKYFVTREEDLVRKIDDISQIKHLCLHIEEPGQPSITYVLPIKRSRIYEREYYFNLLKRKLIKYIKEGK